MNRLLATFAENVTLGDRLVVGLSGRFVTDAERTWFLGDNAQTPAPFNLDGAVSVETVMQVMAQSPGQSVLLLGYPQSSTNSFGSFLREGVGDLDIPQGVTVIYGEPNALQSVLSDAITAPDGDVMDFVRSSRRLTALGFQPQSLVMQPNDDGVVVTLPPVDTSITAWNEAQQANSIEAYTAFRTEYPRSPFAQEAQRRISELEQDPVRLAELAEAGLNLSRNERRAIQRNLTLLDFNTRGVDGIFGPGSRGAIRNWQQDNGFAQTSFLTPSQINRIDGQARRRAAEIEAEEEQAREDALRLDREFWEETGARGDEAGFVAYLDQYPQGTFADEAREGLAELNPPAPEVDNSAARAREDALNINPVLRRLIETRLAGLGYNPGQQDGRFDRNTRRALADYQRASNLTATGFIDQPTLARLLADTFGR
jgi:peptidoglycan hydrolase-like protein with peptidoglycan-binding domain